MKRKGTIENKRFGLNKENGFGKWVKKRIFEFYKRQFYLNTMIKESEITELNFFISIFSYLQILSIPFTQYAKINHQYLLLQIVFYISRPSAYITDSQQEDLNIVCLSIACTFIVLVIFLLIYIQNQTSRRILNYFLTYFNHYCFIIFLEIGYLQLLPYISSSANTIKTISTTSSTQNTTSGFLNGSPVEAFFGVFLIILTQLTSFYQLQFSDSSVNIYESGLSRLYCSPVYIASQLTKHVLVLVLFLDFQNKSNGMLIIIFICAAYFYLSAKDLIKYIPYSDYTKLQANIIGLNLLAIGIILGQILQCYFGTISQQAFLAISILVLPVSCVCTLKYFRKKFINMVIHSLFIQNPQKEERDQEVSQYQQQISISKFSVQLAFFTRNRRNMYKDKDIKMHILCMYEQHSLQCVSATCKCKSLSKMIGIQEGSFEVNAQLIDYFLINICQQILTSKSYIQPNQVFNQLFQLIRYMIQQRKNIFSLQRVIELLCQKQNLQISLNIKIIRGIWLRAGLTVFLEYIRQSMDECFLLELDMKKEIYNTLQACMLFFQVDQIKQDNTQAVLDIIRHKIETLNSIKNGVDSMQIFKELNDNYQQYLEECEEKLTNFYEKIPTRDNQSLLCFFLSEIKSDLKKASDVMQRRQFSHNIDMNLLLGSNTIMQIFSSQVYSLRIGFSKGIGEILWFSQNLPKILGYQRQEFSYHKKLNEILPHILAFYHDDLVNEVKIIKCFKSQSMVFSDTKWVGLFLLRCSSTLTFWIYLRQDSLFSSKSTRPLASLMVNSSLQKIESVSYEILEKVGLETFPINQTIQNFCMDELMSEYDRILGEILQLDKIDSFTYQNIQISVPTIYYFKSMSEMQDRSLIQSTHSIRTQRSKRASILIEQRQFKQFNIDFQIYKKFKVLSEKEVKYYIMDITRMVEVVNNDSVSFYDTDKPDNILDTTVMGDMSFKIAPTGKQSPKGQQKQTSNSKSERDFFYRLNSGDPLFEATNQQKQKEQLKSIFTKKKTSTVKTQKKLTIKQPTKDIDQENKQKQINLPTDILLVNGEINNTTKKKDAADQGTTTTFQFKDDLYNFDDAPSKIENEISIIQHLKELDKTKFNKVNHKSNQFQQNILDELNNSYQGQGQNPYRNLDELESLQQSERNSLFSKRDFNSKVNSNQFIDMSQMSGIQNQDSELQSFMKNGNDQSIAISLQLLESYSQKQKMQKNKPINKKKGFELQKLKSSIEYDFSKNSLANKKQMKGTEQIPILRYDEELSSMRQDNKSQSMVDIKQEHSELIQEPRLSRKELSNKITQDITEGIDNIIIEGRGQDSSAIIKEESETNVYSKTLVTGKSQRSIRSLKSVRSQRSLKSLRSKKTDSQKMKYSTMQKNQAIDMSFSKKKGQTSTFVSTFQQKQHTIETISNNKDENKKEKQKKDKLFNQENNAILAEVKYDLKPEEKEKINNDQQSVTSSLQKSIFSNKYDNFQKFLMMNNPPELRWLKILKSIEFLIVMSITLWANLLFYLSFGNYQDQLALINFRSSTLSPISISLSMVYQQIKNQGLLASGKITTAQYQSANQLLYYYMSEGYNTFISQLEDNISQDYSRNTYTSYEIDLTNYSQTSQEQFPLLMSSILFRSMLFSFNQTALNAPASTAYTFNSVSMNFALDNYSPLYDFFSDLSLNLKNQINDNMDNIQMIFIIQLVCIFLSYIIMQIFQFYYYRKFMQMIKLTLRVYESSTLTSINSEMLRLTNIQNIIDGESSNLIFCYDFDLRAKEISLRAESKKIQQRQEKLMNMQLQRKTTKVKTQLKKDHKQKRKNLKNFRIDRSYISFKSFFILLAINSIPFFAYIAISFSLILQYTTNISQVINTYERFSDAQSYIQSSYILKQQIINYLPASEQSTGSSNYIMKSYLASVNEANYFSSSSIDQYISTLSLLSDSLQDDINQLISQNSCNNTSVYSTNLSSSLLLNLENRCDISLGGQQLGTKAYLSNFLQEMVNLINLNFSKSLQQDSNSDEAILSVISTKVIQQCSQIIHDKLVQTTVLNKTIIFSFGFVFLCIMLGTLCFYIIHENSKMIKEYRRAQHVIFLLPAITLLTDDTFFKQINYLNIKLSDS